MVFGLFKKKKAPVRPAPSKSLVEQVAEIGGQKVAFLQAGPGDKTIVFIHGNSASKEAFSQQFQTVRDAGYGVLAVDLPGHGGSADASDPGAQYIIPAYADLIADLCEHLGVTAPVLCGWSLGGHIAIEMAASNSDYSGIMIFGTPPVGPGMEHLETAFLPSDVSDVTGAENPPEDRLNAYIDALYGSVASVPAALVKAGFRADGRSRSSMFAHWASGASGHDQRQLVQSWRKPILMLHGADDAFISADYFKTLDVPGDGSAATFAVMDGVGHAPFLEDPAAFNEQLLEFCRRSFA